MAAQPRKQLHGRENGPIKKRRRSLQPCETHGVVSSCNSPGKEPAVFMPKPAITAVVVSNEHAPHDPPTQTSGTAQHRADSHNAVCDGCKAAIVGVRYRCSMCPNYDLCDTCMAKTPIAHPAEHLFLRINHPRVPAGVFGKSGVRFSSYPALQNRSKIKHVGVLFCHRCYPQTPSVSCRCPLFQLRYAKHCRHSLPVHGVFQR